MFRGSQNCRHNQSLMYHDIEEIFIKHLLMRPFNILKITLEAKDLIIFVLTQLFFLAVCYQTYVLIQIMVMSSVMMFVILSIPVVSYKRSGHL